MHSHRAWFARIPLLNRTLDPEPLDELEALAIKHYSNVPNLNLKPFVFPVPSLSDKELQVRHFSFARPSRGPNPLSPD